jgi:hypothetical protein
MREFLDFYDLQYESVQKRYTTIALQYYRDRLKSKMEGTKFSREKPEYEAGWRQANIQNVPQPVMY